MLIYSKKRKDRADELASLPAFSDQLAARPRQRDLGSALRRGRFVAQKLKGFL